MEIQTCAHLCARIAVMVAALSVVTASQEPSTASAHYTVITRDGLGLPKDGVDYHAKVLMSEYIPIGHYAVQDSRRGWSYHAAPSWFVQGLQEYDGIYHTTEANRADTAARLMRWARANEGRFACCARGIEFGDVYNGGAAFIAFLASAYGEGIHERILRSEAKTFDEALAEQTSPLSRSELFDRFRAWVRDTQ